MYSVAREDLIDLIVFLQNRPKSVSVPQIAEALLELEDVQDAIEKLTPESQGFLFDEPSDKYGRAQAVADIASWAADGIEVHSILDDSFPARLRDIHECPPILFSAGEPREEEIGVCVVGSRKASDRGLEIATSVATALAHEGVTVISGLAAGIDTAAHTAALAASGRTLAVIGTGLRKSYPAANRSLQAEIVSKGMVVSQFWPDAPPSSWHFPIRNATMSGLGVATFIAEAGEKSGARIQARKAVEHGRPVILSNIVVEKNIWAQNLVGAPNVWTASGVDEVLDRVRSLISARDEISSLLGYAVEKFASAS